MSGGFGIRNAFSLKAGLESKASTKLMKPNWSDEQATARGYLHEWGASSGEQFPLRRLVPWTVGELVLQSLSPKTQTLNPKP